MKQKTDPNWICGLVEGYGTFFISISPEEHVKNKVQVRIGFKITQSTQNVAILFRIKSFFEIGIVRPKDQKVWEYRVNDFDQLFTKILPFFQKYPLHTTKKFDFLRVLYVSKLIQRGDHLTLEGIEKIKKIRERMNVGSVLLNHEIL
jgi:hypothetical protein